MIIFDLDGTLADLEHRRHFVVKHKMPDCTCNPDEFGLDGYNNCALHDYFDWKPDWKSFYEACDKDKPIKNVIKIYNALGSTYGKEMKMQIWTGRDESVRDKTLSWIYNNLDVCFIESRLKMRPTGDFTPDNELKEKWLYESLAQGKKIDFVFDDRPNVVRMWRKHGIFVFNCCQQDDEF